MKGYGQFCPIAKAWEILGERWTPLVLREMIAGSRRFNELRRGVPLMSPSLLSRRLRMLEEAGIVARDRETGDYALTEAGKELRPLIEQLGVWGQRWAQRQISPEDLDPALLMWDVSRRIDTAAFPEVRTLVRFEFRGVPPHKRLWWLLGNSDGVEICLSDPGFEVDLDVLADIRAMVEVWTGHRDLAEALASGTIELFGPGPLRESFPRWLKLGVFARVERPG